MRKKNDSQISKLSSWTMMVFMEASKEIENGKREMRLVEREVSQALCGQRCLFEN